MPWASNTSASFCCQSAVSFHKRKGGLSSALAWRKGEASDTARLLDHAAGLALDAGGHVLRHQLAPQEAQGPAHGEGVPDLDAVAVVHDLMGIVHAGQGEAREVGVA